MLYTNAFVSKISLFYPRESSQSLIFISRMLKMNPQGIVLCCRITKMLQGYWLVKYSCTTNF